MTLVGTLVPELVLSVTVVAVTVAGSRERDIAAVTVGLRGTPLAPAAGEVAVTVGGGSAVEATVKLHEYGVPRVASSVASTVAASRAV